MQLFQHGASYLCCQAASTTRVAALLGAPHSARGRRTRQHAGEAFLNLPGWCWARIKQLALIGSSSSLHSEACKALGGSDGVVHSTISPAAICMRAVANDAPHPSCRGILPRILGERYKRMRRVLLLPNQGHAFFHLFVRCICHQSIPLDTFLGIFLRVLIYAASAPLPQSSKCSPSQFCLQAHWENLSIAMLDIQGSPPFLLDSLRGSSVKIGTIQRRLAWPLRKDDTHKSRRVHKKRILQNLPKKH